MWLLIPEGFYSVVQKNGETDLSVRARVKDDLERLRERYLPELSEIIETPQGDYRYRAWVDRASFADALARIGQELDYDNFKSEVARRDPARSPMSTARSGACSERFSLAVLTGPATIKRSHRAERSTNPAARRAAADDVF